nr:acyltransferase [uncultured Methanoregula sp.]
MTEKVAYLEGLRGIASFVVYLGHLFPLFIGISMISIAFGTWRSFSVCIFFVLSGFVLTSAFFSSGGQERLVSGAVRRYIRLLVPIAAVLFVIYIFICPGLNGLGNFTAFGEMIYQVFWGVFFQGQTAFTPLENNYTGTLWTMTVEFIGSFIVFAFASLFGNLRNRWIFYMVAILVFLQTYFLAFILGMALADLYTGSSRENYRIKNTLSVVCIGSIGLFFGSYTFLIAGMGNLRSNIESMATAASSALSFGYPSLFQQGIASITELLYIIGAFLLLLSLLNSQWFQTVLSAGIPVFLGKISFSLYLIHMTVIFIFSSVIFRLLFQQPSLVAGLFMTLLTTPVLLGVSYLMYRYVDQPGIALSKWVYNRYFVVPSHEQVTEPGP